MKQSVCVKRNIKKKITKKSLIENSERTKHFIIGLLVLTFLISYLLYCVIPPSAWKVKFDFLSFSASTNYQFCHQNISEWLSKVTFHRCENKLPGLLNQLIEPKRNGIHLSPKLVWDYADSSQRNCNKCGANGIGVNAGHCFRNATISGIRCLPSFIIAGTMKSGTGELMKWLDSHPYLKAGKGKSGKNEIHFFGADYDNARCKWLEYLKMFPYLGIDFSKVYTFDKSPDYFRSAQKMKQIRNLLPDVKIIVLLRNPTLRAISEFDHNCRHGRYVKLLRTITVDLQSTTSLYSQQTEDHYGINKTNFKSYRFNSKNGLTHRAGSILTLQYLQRFGLSKVSNNHHKAVSKLPESPRRQNVTGKRISNATDSVASTYDNSSGLRAESLFQNEKMEAEGGEGDLYVEIPYPCRGRDLHDFYFGSSPAVATVASTVLTSTSSTSQITPSHSNDTKLIRNAGNSSFSRLLKADNSWNRKLKSSSALQKQAVLDEKSGGITVSRASPLIFRNHSKIMSSNGTALRHTPIFHNRTKTQLSSYLSRKPYFHTNKSTNHSLLTASLLHKLHSTTTTLSTSRHPTRGQQSAVAEVVGGVLHEGGVAVAAASLEEASHGFYDDQLSDALKIFPPDQVLVLFQEDMYRDTYQTLREVEAFLGIPCFDFSSIATPGPPGVPPKRRPVTLQDKIQRLKELIFGKTHGSDLLQAELPALPSPSAKPAPLQRVVHLGAKKTIIKESPLCPSSQTQDYQAIRSHNPVGATVVGGTTGPADTGMGGGAHSDRYSNRSSYRKASCTSWQQLAFSNFSDLRWVRPALDEFYRPHNRRLQALLQAHFHKSIPSSWPT